MPTDRPTITTPVNGTQLPLPASVAFDWTGVAGADRQFTNPNGTGPDPVNGFGGVGGGFVLGGTGFAEPMATSPAMEVPPARPAAPPRRHGSPLIE